MDLLEQLYNHSSNLFALVKEVETADWPARSTANHCRTERILPQAQHLLRPEEIAQLVLDYQAGVSVKELAGKYQINRSTVLAHLKRQEVPRRRSRLSSLDVEKIVGLYLAGESVEAVAHELRVGETTVRRALVKAGVELRRRGRKPLIAR